MQIKICLPCLCFSESNLDQSKNSSLLIRHTLSPIQIDFTFFICCLRTLLLWKSCGQPGDEQQHLNAPLSCLETVTVPSAKGRSTDWTHRWVCLSLAFLLVKVSVLQELQVQDLSDMARKWNGSWMKRGGNRKDGKIYQVKQLIICCRFKPSWNTLIHQILMEVLNLNCIINQALMAVNYI